MRWLIEGYVAGRVAPEQMSAWAMAVVWRGLSDAETHELTQAMIDSGATIDLSSLGRTVVDKHSTGGVGDKTTIALAPLAAAMGMPVAKLSGRGLAHTGGTLDKLEAIPGLQGGSQRRRADRAGRAHRLRAWQLSPTTSCPPIACSTRCATSPARCRRPG